MSVANGLDKLQKEIDALTYNARTVLNALIRSVVASGSEDGFTITRSGVTLTLSRVDIYRLYNFYRAWEITNFNAEDFYIILTEQNQTYVKVVVDGQPVVITNATTLALVKHSQILYLNDANKEFDVNTDSAYSYWLNLIVTADNPKLITNSAPIPINLRTPVFDPNLATTRYNNQPSYLFPYQYFNLTTLGYTNDGINHQLSGNSWTISGDVFVDINSGAVSTGSANKASIFKTPERRNLDYLNNTIRTATPYSFVWGYDTFARGSYSTAGGLSSAVPYGSTGATAIGYDDIASNEYAASVGGIYNSVSSTSGGIFAGSGNTVTGQYGGILAGVGNIVGGPVYSWKFGTANVTSECIFIAENCTTDVITSGALGRNVLFVNGNIVSQYKIGDIVRIFDFTTTVNNTTGNPYYSANGDAWTALALEIAGSPVYDSKTNLTTITLTSSIPYSTAIDGGKISLIQRVQNGLSYNVGFCSSAFGNSNIAMGVNQTVIGHNNRYLLDPLFIIGSGSSSTSRQNRVEVYNDNVILYGTPSSDSGPFPPPLINYVTYVDYIDYSYDNGFTGFQVNSQFIEATASPNRFHIDSSSFDIIKYISDDSRVGGLRYPDPLYSNGISLTNANGPLRLTASQNNYIFSPLGTHDVGVFAQGAIYIESDNDLNITSLNNINITAADTITLDGANIVIKGSASSTSASTSISGGSAFADVVSKITEINLNGDGVDIPSGSSFSDYINAAGLSISDTFMNYYFDFNFVNLSKKIANPAGTSITAGTVTTQIQVIFDNTVNFGASTARYLSTSNYPTSSLTTALGTVNSNRSSVTLSWYEIQFSQNILTMTKWQEYNTGSTPFDTISQAAFDRSVDIYPHVVFNGTHYNTSVALNSISPFPTTLNASINKYTNTNNITGPGSGETVTDASTISKAFNCYFNNFITTDNINATATCNLVMQTAALTASLPTSQCYSLGIGINLKNPLMNGPIQYTIVNAPTIPSLGGTISAISPLVSQLISIGTSGGYEYFITYQVQSNAYISISFYKRSSTTPLDYTRVTSNSEPVLCLLNSTPTITLKPVSGVKIKVS